MKISGGKAIFESLLKEGVDTIFGYPGGAIMPTYDALYHYEKKIKHVLVRHEQGAAHAAEGYARLTGRPGVCMATSGPGATNLVTGIADAMMDSIPLVCITGQVAAQFVGTDAFQETDVVGVTTPITKWNYQVTSADEIPAAIAKGFYIARSGRPGPVLIDITKNAQIDMMEFSYPKKVTIEGYIPEPAIDVTAIKKAAALINAAQKPYLFVGHGVLISKAEKELLHFVEKAGIPVASTLHGLSAFPTSHPLYVGMLGMHGKYSTNMLTNKADLIIALGMRFDDRVTGKLSGYAKQAKIVHIDIDVAEINKNVPVTVGVSGDAKQVLTKLIPLIKKNSHPAWRKEFAKLDKVEDEKVTQKELAQDTEHVKMAEVITMLSEKTQGNAVIVADVGQHQMIAARYSQFAKSNSFVTSGGLGTMGFALPAAIGAKFGAPKREIIAVIGDGCFQMTLQELATISQENLPVKIIILNNNFLGMVRQWQQLFFEKRYSFVQLKNPDFVQVAKGFFINGEKVATREQVSGALDRLLAAKEAYILDITVEKEGNVFPMVPSGASCDEVVLE